MRRTLSLTALAAAALLLAGCSVLPFGNDDPATGGSDGGGGSGGTGQSDPSGPGSGDEGAGDDGAVVVGPGQLPASWPAEVHVPDGDVVTAVESSGSWVAEIAVADEVAAFAEVSAALKEAGFTAVAETSGASGSIGVYQNDRYQVQVLASRDGGGPALTYSIVTKG